MKCLKLFVLLAVLAFSDCIAFGAPLPSRAVLDFDSDWKFLQRDEPHGEQPSLNDASWREVSVPHDWSIAGPVAQNNPSGQGGGFFPAGVAWYRKSFSLPEKEANRRVYIVFDGVMANSEVWINGYHLGRRPNGYASFYYEITGHLQFGSAAHNVLAVRCDTSQQPASRWYEGGGINRPVRLVLLGNLHLEPWSTYLTTPSITATQAKVRAQSTATNESPVPQKAALEITLTAPDGRVAGSISTPEQTIAPGAQAHYSVEIPVAGPQLWDLDHPSLYKVRVRVQSRQAAAKSLTICDEEQLHIGLREFHFDPATGFWLNGRNFKIKGVALHADGGAVGIAVPMAIWERRLNTLRSLGVNAIRTAHDLPSPEFLDLCDRMGFLVMDEFFDCWTVGKNPYDYHLNFTQWFEIDARDTVRRDRNHPSVILWSAGNEIRDTNNAELARGILSKLIAVFHENDPSRPVTQALFRPNVSHDYDNGLADMLDVVGQNYRENEILAAYEQKPSRAILGTENTHDRAAWLALRDHAPYAGQFLWTGVDYLGEAGQWPLIGRPFGLLDRTGLPHPRALERQSWWAAEPNVHLVRRVGDSEKAAVDPGYEVVPPSMQEPLRMDWTSRNSAPHSESVEAYTNCDEVELFLNGRSLGKQLKHPDASPLLWEVPYEPGSLKAVAYLQGRQASLDELRTAGRAVRIVLAPDRTRTSPDHNDAITIVATAVDEAGVPVPDASADVQFSVAGPGEIVATDSGSNTDHERFLLSRRRLYEGRMIAIVRATGSSGEIRIRASAPGMLEGATSIQAVPSTPPEFSRYF
jgi:beta-galactosidase